MAKYSVRIKPAALKELEQLPAKIVRQIIQRIEDLATNPRPMGVEKLAGVDGYRVRQGNYRIVYAIDDHAREVDVYKIGHRREVYR